MEVEGELVVGRGELEPILESRGQGACGRFRPPHHFVARPHLAGAVLAKRFRPGSDGFALRTRSGTRSRSRPASSAGRRRDLLAEFLVLPLKIPEACVGLLLGLEELAVGLLKSAQACFHVARRGSRRRDGGRQWRRRHGRLGGLGRQAGGCHHGRQDPAQRPWSHGASSTCPSEDAPRPRSIAGGFSYFIGRRNLRLESILRIAEPFSAGSSSGDALPGWTLPRNAQPHPRRTACSPHRER